MAISALLAQRVLQTGKLNPPILHDPDRGLPFFDRFDDQEPLAVGCDVVAKASTLKSLRIPKEPDSRANGEAWHCCHRHGDEPVTLGVEDLLAVFSPTRTHAAIRRDLLFAATFGKALDVDFVSA